MFEGINAEDRKQLFMGGVVLYRNRPVKILSFSAENLVSFFDILKQKTFTEPMKEAAITPVTRRLGMVNRLGGCYFLQRKVIRQYHVGLDHVNVSVLPVGASSTIEGVALRSFTAVEIGHTLFNRFPSFEEAVKVSKEFEQVVAFDRQFCVEFGRGIYYKTQLCGEVKDNVINWYQNMGYCKHLLGEFNANNFRDI